MRSRAARRSLVTRSRIRAGAAQTGRVAGRTAGMMTATASPCEAASSIASSRADSESVVLDVTTKR